MLKNDNEVLPIKSESKNIAVIGNIAKKPKLGGYSSWGIEKSTILDGMKNYTKHDYNIFDFIDLAENTEGSFVTVTVKNIGPYDGEEVVQLYINDLYSSVVTPCIELKDFERVFIKCGESKIVNFKITPDKLSFLNQKFEYVVEPGEFEIMVGESCRNIKLKKILTVIKKI